MSETDQLSRIEAANAQASESVPVRRKRILLAEGDGFTRLVLLFRLRLAGFQVDFTSNGILALGKLRNGNPDALLVELKLGGLSGLELIRAAREDPAFTNRPIYVYTYAEKMNRSARKEVRMLATKVFDKALMTREEVVQTFAALLNGHPSTGERPAARVAAATAAQQDEAEELALPGALEEIIAGVREQSKAVSQCHEGDVGVAKCEELLSRVRSLASCAEAAKLSELGRHAKALENFLKELRKAKRGCNDTNLDTVTRAVEIMDTISRQPTGGNQAPTQFNVVVVDEAPPSNIAITGALVNAGFEPIAFEDAGSAREYLASSFTHLILINVSLPETHGLTLNEIRSLPLHVDTPVIYVTAPPDPEHWTEQPPGGAVRLDRNPLLLTELIMKALNDVQGAGSPANGSSHSPAPESLAPSAAASQPSGDYFELFAGPKQSQGATLSQAHAEPVAFAAQEPGWAVPVAEPESEASASLAAAVLGEQSSGKMNLFARRLQQATAQTEVSPEEPMQAPAGWPQTLPEQQETGNGTAQPEAEPVMPLESSEAVMPMAGLPAEQPARTEPGASGGEYQADTWSILPAGSTDGEQVPEQPPIQMAAQPSLLQAEAPEAAQPEVTSDNQATAAPEANTVPEAVPDATPPSGAADPKALAYGWTLPAATAEPQPEASGQSDTVHMQRAENLDALAQPREAEASQNGEADAGGQIAELEEQVRRSVAALARATADLAAERGERQRSEQRTVRLTARLQELHEELGGALQAQRESLQRISALEGQLGQTDEALARRTADLEQQQADRRLAEEQLRKARELNAQLRQDLAFLDDANKGFNRMQNELAAKLEASRSAVLESETKFHGRLDERQNQVEVLDTLQRELQKHARKTESLEKELQTTSEALRESEARCQQEAAERQRLNAALTAAELNLRDRSTRSDLEFCKLESALQVEQAERNRQERQLARARQASADSLRAVRALRKSLRRQIREPIDNLYHSARHLLELEMGQEQKQLAQAVLQDVLLVHTRLREPETPSGEASDTQTALATKPV